MRKEKTALGELFFHKYTIMLSGSIGDHSHLARAFYGCGNHSLVVGAEAGFLSRFYFIKSRDKTEQQFAVFIIYVVNVFLTKIARHVFYIKMEYLLRRFLLLRHRYWCSWEEYSFLQ